MPPWRTRGAARAYSRVVAAGGSFWKKEDVSLWDYPDRQTNLVAQLDRQGRDVRDFRWLPFQGPVTAEFEKDTGKLNISPGNRKQMKSRVTQLQGDCAGAIRNYLLVQLEELPQALPVPEEAQARFGRHATTRNQGPWSPRSANGLRHELPGGGGRQVLDGSLPVGAEYARVSERNARSLLAALPGNRQMALPGRPLRGMVLAKAGKYALAVQQVNERLADSSGG